jgi:hypothetical protein
MPERLVPVDLGDHEAEMVFIAEQVGNVPVANVHIAAQLPAIMSSIERVSREALVAVRRAGPDKATVELGFGLAIEAGQVIALFGKAHGEASIKVTLEWSRGTARAQPDDLSAIAREPAAASS